MRTQRVKYKYNYMYNIAYTYSTRHLLCIGIACVSHEV